jgi:hypothetical protein
VSGKAQPEIMVMSSIVGASVMSSIVMAGAPAVLSWVQLPGSSTPVYGRETIKTVITVHGTGIVRVIHNVPGMVGVTSATYRNVATHYTVTNYQNVQVQTGVIVTPGQWLP